RVALNQCNFRIFQDEVSYFYISEKQRPEADRHRHFFDPGERITISRKHLDILKGNRRQPRKPDVADLKIYVVPVQQYSLGPFHGFVKDFSTYGQPHAYANQHE